MARAALVFATLSSESRLRIMALLDEQGATLVSVVAAAAGLRLSHTSQQLRVLREAGLIKRAGPGVYEVADHGLWIAVHGLVVSGSG